MNAKAVKRLRRTAVIVQNELGLPWVKWERDRMGDCGKRLYRIFKRNYTRYKHPLGELK